MCTKINFIHAPCPTCKDKVEGRTDKRFCSVKCKNEHHRMARNLIKTRFQELQKSLYRNIVVLEGILGTENNRMRIHKDALLDVGFNFEIGNYAQSKKQKSTFELVNYTYTMDKSGVVYVKRQEKLSEDMPIFFDRWLIDFPLELKVGGNGLENSSDSASKFERWNE